MNPVSGVAFDPPVKIVCALVPLDDWLCTLALEAGIMVNAWDDACQWRFAPLAATVPRVLSVYTLVEPEA